MSINTSSSELRTLYAALEDPLLCLLDAARSIKKSILWKDNHLVALAKQIDEVAISLEKDYYAEDDHVTEFPVFKKFIDTWCTPENFNTPVTEIELKNVEESLGQNLRLPQSYTKNVITFGLPETLPELKHRIKDLNLHGLGIKRFLAPQEIVDTSLKLRANIQQNREIFKDIVAVALNENGHCLCYTTLASTPENNPNNFSNVTKTGKFDYICNPESFECEAYYAKCFTFDQCINICANIKKLNATASSYKKLNNHIIKVSDLLNTVINEEQFQNNPRYIHVFSSIIYSVKTLNSVYKENFSPLSLVK